MIGIRDLLDKIKNGEIILKHVTIDFNDFTGTGRFSGGIFSAKFNKGR